MSIDEMSKSNGISADCPVADDWFKHRKETGETAQKVKDMHATLAKIEQHASHLQKLDLIADHLMDAATGKNQIEMKSVHFMMKIAGVVIIGLTFIIFFLITGDSLKWFDIKGI